MGSGFGSGSTNSKSKLQPALYSLALSRRSPPHPPSASLAPGAPGDTHLAAVDLLKRAEDIKDARSDVLAGERRGRVRAEGGDLDAEGGDGGDSGAGDGARSGAEGEAEHGGDDGNGEGGVGDGESTCWWVGV